MAVTLRPEIAALTPYRQGRPAAADAFKLSSNENPAPPHPAVLEAIGRSELNRYPDGAAVALREQLAARHGLALDQVHVGAGSVSILGQLILAAAGPGDEVLYAWRSFEAYPGLVTVAGATSTTVPLLEGARHDLEAMAAAVTERTRVAIVCSPNNPTSAIVTEAEFRAFLAAVPETLLVILDEAYREFVTDPEAVDGIGLLAEHPNLVVLRTFSKAYGLAGLRVGYALGEETLLDAARSAAIPLSVTEPAQRAARAALDHQGEILEGVAELVERRERVAEALRAQGWAIAGPEGNFVWLPTGEHTAAAAEVLERHGIVARVFPPDGVRVSIGEEASVEKLLQAAAEVWRSSTERG
ncbi:histidinol-phosphate transaminase [Homoserinibacter sp. YIM 151385]|uniref:histidinol-phosphate transaminase n=1 Tax=Homoserinibacter sp. YIM 151385 TaxID=2985506 RepID=UPI0022F0478D|nr:histidinol-phosphate transaminase [Homoserinibacter sp. YIM 151385]WBU37273.1 histidinol-phosphate transaminase [Homoserinibacter sp. YIM 151385]